MNQIIPAPEEQLGELFGSYRAEWLAERIYDLFTEPAYFPEMTARTACVLEGGRGTGKTTVLRGLSYQGQYALKKRNALAISDLEFVGCYLRVDTNVVTAFSGPELTELVWGKVFAHYFNMLICEQLCKYWTWFIDNIDVTTSAICEQLSEVSISLHLTETNDVRALGKSIRKEVIALEAYINNIGDETNLPKLSLQGAPIKLLAEAMSEQPAFRGKRFFVLLDEYENFLEYQQRVVNTLIKHGAQNLTYKIAIRELGWKSRTTLNPDEQLLSPADYVRVYIGEKLEGAVFKAFALRVCNDRVRRLNIPGIGQDSSIEDLLPALSEDEEATLLVGSDAIKKIHKKLIESTSGANRETVDRMSPTELLLLQYWSRSSGTSETKVLEEAVQNKAVWQNRRTNYSHAMLFTLRRGKRGIQKYYAGWDTFIQLSNGNIRFLLALVDQCLHLQLREQPERVGPISPETQTKAAQMVGKANLSELEGLSIYGAKLTRLLLGLGRVFGVLASQAEGHSPEQTQFELADREMINENDETDQLLRAAVMHLALIRSAGTKPTSDNDTKEYDYMIHPVYAPFFAFSYRKKRKIKLHPSDILGLGQDPQAVIKAILKRQHRAPNGESLPEQMSLFRQFYGDDH